MRVWTVLVIGGCAIAGCGGAGSQRPDAGASDAAPVDAAPPDAEVAPCQYRERSDATNAPAPDPDVDVAESTGLVIGSEPRTLCGSIDTGHFDVATQMVDNDVYRVTADRSGALIVRFTGGAGAAAMADFAVYLRSGATPLFGASRTATVRDHGVFIWPVSAGDYEVLVTARNPNDPSTGFPYKVQLALDTPGRCAAVAGPPSYREIADRADADNDVIAIDFDEEPHVQLTPTTGDSAEPTGLVIGGATRVHITGVSDGADRTDDYLDRDTYAIRTGPDTTELTLRLDRGDAPVNLDDAVFPADQTEEVGSSFGQAGDEKYSIIAVAPDTTYWIWVGSQDGGTSLPVPYDVTICGDAALLPGGPR